MSDLPAWGAARTPDGDVRFRLWAPDMDRMTLRLDGQDHPMDAEGDGWFSLARPAADGAPYAFVLPDGTIVPDPASRRQEGSVHGASLVSDAAHAWQQDWHGRPWEEAVICELHVGTFTEAGTFRAAIDRLDHLAETGFAAIELMPVAQFGGDRGWGYDGVLPYAPHPAYGSPDDLRALVDEAHARGLMVLLDVVYNHFGPDGNYLPLYASAFFDADRQTPWGDGIDYSKPPVRRFVIDNALYWLTEFRLDGLRFDAIDHIRDTSEPELMIEMAREIRSAITDRPIHLTTEDNRNVTHLHERGEDGSVPLHTAEWNDDFHNVAHVVATLEAEGYYRDFAAKEWSLIARALAEGFAYQGEFSAHEGEARGKPSAHLPPTAFVDFLQNHDQIGNRAYGERLEALTDAPMMEALTAILLLSPHIPLMFMGEEYGETRPFCFFAGFEGDLGRAVTEGRRREFADFGAFASGGTDNVPDPIAIGTFETSRLDWSEAATDRGRAHIERIRALLSLRADRIVPLLRGAGGDAGRVVADRDGIVAVDWALNGGHLQLRANLLDTAAEMPSARGERIHLAGSEVGAPHSAAFWIELA